MTIARVLLAVVGTALALGHFDAEYRFRFDAYATRQVRWYTPPAALQLILPLSAALGAIGSAWLAIWWPVALSFFGALVLADWRFSHRQPFEVTGEPSPGHRDGPMQLIIGAGALVMAGLQGALNPWLLIAGAAGPALLPGLLCALRDLLRRPAPRKPAELVLIPVDRTFFVPATVVIGEAGVKYAYGTVAGRRYSPGADYPINGEISVPQIPVRYFYKLREFESIGEARKEIEKLSAQARAEETEAE